MRCRVEREGVSRALREHGMREQQAQNAGGQRSHNMSPQPRESVRHGAQKNSSTQRGQTYPAPGDGRSSSSAAEGKLSPHSGRRRGETTERGAVLLKVNIGAKRLSPFSLKGNGTFDFERSGVSGELLQSKASREPGIWEVAFGATERADGVSRRLFGSAAGKRSDLPMGRRTNRRKDEARRKLGEQRLLYNRQARL